MVRPADSDSDVTADEEVDRVQRIPSKVNKNRKIIQPVTIESTPAAAQMSNNLPPTGDHQVNKTEQLKHTSDSNEVTQLLKQLCRKIDQLIQPQQAKPPRSSTQSFGRIPFNRSRAQNQNDQMPLQGSQFECY
jgi:hypothetical protein